jgi:hypothetical protein
MVAFALGAFALGAFALGAAAAVGGNGGAAATAAVVDTEGPRLTIAWRSVQRGQNQSPAGRFWSGGSQQ